MRDDDCRDALFDALEADAGDAVSLAALADWSEEQGDDAAAACLRWLAGQGRRPFYFPRPGDRGPFLWILRDDEPLVKDEAAQLPPALWRELKGNDEPGEVASYKSYRTARLAYLAAVGAWPLAPQPTA